jgi:hypothetical protein
MSEFAGIGTDEEFAFPDWQHDKEHLLEEAQKYMAVPGNKRRILDLHGKNKHGELLRTWGVPLGWLDVATEGVGRFMDADGLLVHESGLALLLEFKHESEHDYEPDKLMRGQHLALAGLAMSGLVTCYAIKYTDPGSNDRLPKVTEIRRVTDPFAPTSRWMAADFGDLLLELCNWSRNALNKEFVYRQRTAAWMSQRYQLSQPRAAPHRTTDMLTSEALRLTARDMRDGTLLTACSEAEFAARVQEHFAMLWRDGPGPRSRR